MQHDLTVTLVQFDIKWHDASANWRTIDALLTNAIEDNPSHSDTNMVVLPEMFNSGFTMASTQVAERMDGATVAWMGDCARKYEAVVTGTIAIEENGQYFNRLLFVHPDGTIQHYDKRHLFRMADEHTAYSAGTQQPIFSYLGWRLRPIICYDLRFPVWCRQSDSHYDALICPANWPDPRHNAWLSLLTARAIENQCYMIANNRIGIDYHDKNYLGNSQVIDAKGRTLSDAGISENVITTTLSKAELERFRTKFPIHADADAFELVDQ